MPDEVKVHCNKDGEFKYVVEGLFYRSIFYALNKTAAKKKYQKAYGIFDIIYKVELI